MSNHFTVFSPVAGVAVPLEQVPDPVFSEHMLGDGIAVDPTEQTVYAPFDGKIISFNKESHAFVMGANGVEILVHVGLETVTLKGEGFTPLAKTGDLVKKGQPLLTFDPQVLAKKATSSLVMVVVTTPPESVAQAKATGTLQAGDPLFELAAVSQTQDAAADEPLLESAPLKVLNPNGLHARPAGVLAQLALKYPFPVEIVKQGTAANAKSVVAVMGLALACNDTVTLRAGGPQDQAKAFLAQLETAFKEGLGENISAPAAPNDPAAPSEQTALTACAGLAFGTAFPYQAADVSFEETAADSAAEQKRLQQTVQAVIAETESKMAAEKNEEAKTILGAHLSILQDPELAKQAQQFVQAGKSAAYAISEAIRASIGVLQKTGNAFLMERAADLKDLRRALLLRLGGKSQTAPQVPQGCILLAEELLPSEASALEGRAAGVLLAAGSPTAHASIILRNMGIPTVVRGGKKVLDIPAGTPLCLDADQALFIANPTPQQQADFSKRLAQHRQERLEQQQNAREKACTQDGVQIWVEGNVSNEKEAAHAIENGADGLGLVRTEFLFHGRQQAPSLQEQQSVYQAVVTAAQGRPVTLRTLDAGGDKPLPFVHIPKEENPIVGIRGIRAFKHNEDFFRTQLRAMLSVAPKTGNLRIMLPMVAFTEEMDFFKQLIAQEKQALGLQQDVKIGMMVEVPSAALTSSQMAARADFFSIGTNDLTQYTLAIDRGHKELSARADSLHPAVLRLIGLTCEGAKQHGKPVAVCGAMAGEPAAVPFLIGLGVTELAVGGGAIASIKALVRRLDARQCAQAAQKAVALADAKEVRALAKSVFHI